MLSSRWFILPCLAALACTPKLNGTCASDGDCHPGESCSSEGLCLHPGTASGDGDAGDAGNLSDAGDAGNPSDAGDAGNPSDAGDAGLGTSATIDILSPAAGATEKGIFHVSAQTSSAITIQDVTFYLTDASSGSAVGQLAVTASTLNDWSGDLTLNVLTFGGGANLRAVIHRTGLADVTSATVNITVDQNAPSISPSWAAGQWWALDAGLTLTATATDDRSGVASATLILPDGGSFAGNISGTTATFQLPAAAVGMPGAALHVPVSLAATDGAGNSTLLPSASSIAVDAQPPTIALVALDPTVWRNGPLDVNANVSDGTGSGVGSTSLLLNSAFTLGTPDGGGGFNYHVNLATLPPTEAAVGLQAVGVDNVGNQADAGFSLNVDNIAPVISAALIDTAFDGTDSAGQGWFAGPTAAPSATAIAVSAVVKDTNLVITGTQRPAVIVGGTSYPGTFNSTTSRWGFSIPRSVGKNASAPITVSFDAQDLAGNHPVSPPSLSLQFDDVPASAFKPAIPADATWYARAASVIPQIPVTLSTPPRSGVASILLKVSGQTDVTCSGSGTSYSCALPTTDAAAATEGALSFSVVATSTTKIASSNTGSRNVDGVAPVIQNASTVYPPAAGGALSWGHNGSRFTVQDNLALWSLQAFDCGAGVDASSSGVSFSPTPASLTVSISDSGTRHSCANGVSAIIYNVTASANLSTTPAGSFSAMDNSLALTATIKDSATGGAHVLSPAPVTTVAVTRRLWTVAAPAATSYLSLGPQLFAGGTGGLYAIAPATGVLSMWQSGDPFNAVIAPNNGTPAVFIADPATESAPVGLYVTAGNASSTTTSAFGSCDMKPSGSAGTDTYAILGYELSGNASINAQVTRSHCTASNNTCCFNLGDPSGCGATLDASCCTSWSISNFQGAMALFGGAVASCSTPSSSASGSACAGAPTPPAAISTPVSTASGLFVGASAAPAWVLTNSGGTVLGTWASTTAGHGWPIVDGSPTPVAYLPDVAAGGIDAVQIGSSGFGTRLYNLSPPFPSTISDMTLSSGGILYVLSSNNVYAIITDSTGSEANQASAWPLRCHDPCRSSLAGFSCPY